MEGLWFLAFLVLIGAVWATVYLIGEYTLAIFHIRLELLVLQMQREGCFQKKEEDPVSQHSPQRYGFYCVEAVTSPPDKSPEEDG